MVAHESCSYSRRLLPCNCTASTELNVQFAWVDVAKSGCAMTNAVLFARESSGESRGALVDSAV